MIRTLTAADAWREVVGRRIALTPVFDGKLWAASVDEKGTGVASKKRNVRSISATASSPIGAIGQLIEKLEPEPEFIEWIG